LNFETTRPHVELDSVSHVSMFSNHFLALKDNGSVWACGMNNYSQLGDGTLKRSDKPVKVYGN